MSLRKIILLLLVSVGIVGATYVINNPLSTSSEAETSALPLDGSQPIAAQVTTDHLIAFWRGRFDDNPRDFISLTFLGQAYLRQARETGDVAAYERAENAFRQALDLNPKYKIAQGYLSAALFARHDFQGALDLANKIYVSDPHALQVLGTMGDAKLELGDYAGATSAYGELMKRAPSPPVYSRLARLAWLQGRSSEAIDLMQRAATEAPGLGYVGEEAAWYEFQVGELYFNTGKPLDAEKHYAASLGYFDHYYLALAGLAKIYAAQAQYDQAIAYYQRAVNIIPQPTLLAALGDVYTMTGQPDKAEQQYKTVDFIAQLAAINKVVYNRELVLFDANHDRQLDQALNLAANELAVRKDIYGHDAHAWALYKNGKYQLAAETMTQAMKLGTRDALLFYHAGMIYAGLGDRIRAHDLLTQALSINPNFDLLQAQIARTTLAQLGAN